MQTVMKKNTENQKASKRLALCVTFSPSNRILAAVWHRTLVCSSSAGVTLPRIITNAALLLLNINVPRYPMSQQFITWLLVNFSQTNEFISSEIFLVMSAVYRNRSTSAKYYHSIVIIYSFQTGMTPLLFGSHQSSKYFFFVFHRRKSTKNDHSCRSKHEVSL